MLTQRLLAGLVALLGLAPLLTGADEKAPPAKADYSELSKKIQQAVIPQIPKQTEDTSEWGKTIPVHNDLRAPKLKRVIVKKDGKDEFPHGSWKRTKVTFDDPAKDVKIEVKDLKKIEGNLYRLQVDSTISAHSERQQQQWKNGVKLLDITAYADVVVTVALECDVKATLKLNKFPPDVEVEPKVVDSKILLKEFNLRRLGLIDGGVIQVGGPLVQDLGNELKDIIQAQLKSKEPQIIEGANQAIAKGLKDGKATFPAASLLKSTTPSKSKE
jgi:hypothetical protein